MKISSNIGSGAGTGERFASLVQSTFESDLPEANAAIPDRVKSRLLGGRLSGPGGYYNLGNGIGQLGGLMLALAEAAHGSGLSVHVGLAAVWNQLAGNLGALGISAAMLIFFWSGENYHQAWANGAPPDPRRNFMGDLLSGYGALMLGLGLLLTGQPLLAATSGLMHAAGKFGSARHPRGSRLILGGRIDLFRAVVLASRVPALAVVTLEIGSVLAGPAQPLALASPVLLLVCYLIWTRADITLFRDA